MSEITMSPESIEMPEPVETPKPEDKPLPGKTVQLRTLIERTGKPYKEIRRLLTSAGLWREKMRYFSKIDIEDALKALSLDAIPPPSVRNVENRTIQREDADLSAAIKAGKFIAPKGASTGSGNLSDDPVPKAILDGDFVEQLDAFPYPRPDNIPSNIIVSAINNSPGPVAEAHREAKISIGWRWIDAGATDLLNRLYPDGKWRRMVGPQGRIVYKDLALACYPRSAWNRRKMQQKEITGTRIDATRESFAANVSDAQRAVQDKFGIKGEHHIQPIVEDSETADDRANFQTAKASGRRRRTAR